jgi:hypothetical protein
MTLKPRITAVLASVLLALTAQPVQAQDPQPGLSMSVEAGFGGYIKELTWTPLRVNLNNEGQPFDGELRVINSRTQADVSFVQPISLGRGSRRSVTLFVPGNTNSFEVQLRQGEQIVLSNAPAVRQLTGIDRLAVVVSDPPDAFNFLGDTRNPFGGGTALAPLRLDQLPDRAAALDAIDVLVFASVDTSALSRAQRTAIQNWVLSGGHLVLAGGPGATATASGLTDLAPAQAAGTLTQADAAALTDVIAPGSIEVAPAPTAAVW